jgi:hypothetical protein
MEKKNIGLAENHDGEIILNESGTSLTFDQTEESTEQLVQDDKTDDSSKPEKSDPGIGHA